MRSELVVPLIDRQRLVGALNIESTHVAVFSELEKNLLGAVAGLMASAITATFSSRRRLNQARTEAASGALAQLGTVAQSFLHRFANSIGDARGKLLELKDVLPCGSLPKLRKGTVDVASFITNITETLSLAGQAIADFSDRFNPADTRFQLRECSLDDVARVALDQAKVRHAGQPVAFHFTSKPTTGDSQALQELCLPPACMLNEQIYEVIENLINNAVAAIQERGPEFGEGTVSIVVDLPDLFHARLCIEDNGAGIRDEDIPRIFDFGFTTKKRKQHGSGIGLWFCDLYVRQRGGRITVRSRLGEGTIFELLLPTILADSDIAEEGGIDEESSSRD